MGGEVVRASPFQQGVELSRAPKFWKEYLSGAARGSMGQLEKAWASPDMMGKLGHVAGATPLIGPAIASEVERAQGGDIASGLGGTAGVVLPALLGARGGIGTKPLAVESKLAKVLSSPESTMGGWAEQNVVKMLGARPVDVPTVIERARFLSENLPIGGREAMLRTIEGSATKPGLRTAAETRLQAVKARGANIPIDIMDAAENVQKSEPTLITPPGAPSAAPEATAGGQALINALKEEADRLRELALAHGQVVRGQLTSGARTQGANNQIPGEVPASELFKARTQANRAAAKGGAYKSQPLIEPSPSAIASKETAGELGRVLRENVPGLKEVDLNYSTIRQAEDLIKTALQKETAGKAPGYQAVLAKKALEGMLAGGAGGFLIGGPGTAASMATGVGALRVAIELMNSPWYRNLIAKGQFSLADALKAGTPSGFLGKGWAGSTDVSRQLGNE